MKFTLQKKELLFIVMLYGVIIILTLAPFVFGYLNQSPDKVYLGYHILAPGDYSVYYSYIQQVYQGHFFFKDLFTHESITRNMVNTYWLFAGLIGKVFGLSVFWTFQISRILTIPFLLAALYLFVSYIYKSISQRKTLLVFLVFSTGISGLFAFSLFKNVYELFGSYFVPMDLWVAESNIFLTMLHSGHMILALALIVFIFYFMLLAFEHKKSRYSIYAGALCFLLLSFHPFQAPLIFSVLFSYIIVSSIIHKKFQWEMLKHFVIMIFISFPMILYYLWTMSYDMVTIQRAAQNITITPLWHLIFFSMGFLLFFGVFGLYFFFKNKEYQDPKKLFCCIWLVAQIFLIFSPLDFQRRITAGLQIPLVIFALEALWIFGRWLKTKLKQSLYDIFIKNTVIMIFLFIIFFGSTNLFILGLDWYLNYSRYELFYLPRFTMGSLEWIRGRVGENEVILSHYATGYHIPGFAGKTVYVGHNNVETLYFEKKVAQVSNFFSEGMNDLERKSFLEKNNIRYIYYGDLERSLGFFDPSKKDYLEMVFQNNAVSIYRYSGFKGDAGK